MPEDNQLTAERKQAQKRADKLQTELVSSCNDLTTLTAVPEACFGEYFYDNISLFIETAKKNDKAREKVEKMKTRLSARGIVTQHTGVNSDQVKSQLPIFTGDSSLSIIDASDLWETILKNAGIHRQIWGNMILERIKDQPCPIFH